MSSQGPPSNIHFLTAGIARIGRLHEDRASTGAVDNGEDDVQIITDKSDHERNAPEPHVDSADDEDEEAVAQEPADEALQVVFPTQDNELIEDQLPHKLLDPEGERSMYPRSMQIVHSDLRGRDAPRNSLLQAGNFNKIYKPAPVQVTFRGSAGILFTAGALKASQTAAAEEGEVNAKKAGVPLKLHWVMHSQLQGFVLHVDRFAAGDKSSEATVHFHINNILAVKRRASGRSPQQPPG